MANQKIVVGMSGGVDSTVAAILLKEKGFDVIGATLSIPRWKESADFRTPHSPNGKQLKIPHFIIDADALFKDRVVSYFDSEYQKGRTPNPCVVCNRFVKFHLLFEFAKKKGVENVATGHYAITRINKQTGKTELLRGKDPGKDQSYYLSFLPQAYLKQLILPLGEHTKKEVYQIAKKHGFKQFSPFSKQSQDFCYLTGSKTQEYLKHKLPGFPQNGGAIIDAKTGKEIGKHEGLLGYTVGQRKGIKLSGGPYFVKELDFAKNTLFVSKDETFLGSNEAVLSPYSVISGDQESFGKDKTEVLAQVRYRGKPLQAILTTGKDCLRISFKKPARAVTPGQVCAIYQGKSCLGAGFIR